MQAACVYALKAHERWLVQLQADKVISIINKDTDAAVPLLKRGLV